jgi:hypothetical protein
MPPPGGSDGVIGSVFTGLTQNGGGGNGGSGARPRPQPTPRPTPIAESDTMKLCIRYDVHFVDSGAGEDYWTDPTAPRAARGMKATLLRQGQSSPVYEGFLDDGRGEDEEGCTPAFPVSGTASYTLRLASHGRIQGGDLFVHDYDASPPAPLIWVIDAGTLGPGTWLLDLGPPPSRLVNVFNVYQASAFALYRHGGGLANDTGWNLYAARSGSPRECGVGSCYADGSSYISEKGHAYKFIIAHEIGHQIGHALNPSLTGNHCASIQDHELCPEWGCSTGACSGHSMLGYEISKCAIGEGFADFYSADVWNDHEDTDCWLRYWKAEPEDTSPGAPRINCEDDADNAEFPVGYFDRACRRPGPATCSGYEPGCVNGTATTEGVGTELDWMRQFWNLHTRGAVPPSFLEIGAWLTGTPRWGLQDAYRLLDASANADGVSTALRDNWNEHKARNAIDH